MDDSRTTEDSGPINRDNSLLEEDDDDGVGSDVVSDVLSTASEMGTVINIGNMTAKMAEIDAMAALIEASPHFESQQQQLGAADGDEIRELNSGLSLPILESKSFDRPSFLPRNNRSSNGENSYPPDLGLRHHTSTTGTSTMATATTSAAVSAAIRRIGSGLTNATANKKNHHSSLSAPPTPKTPGVPPPPRVKDLLKSALTPQSSANHGNADHRHPPPSFALRSPGSRARMEHKQGAARATNASLLTPRFSAPSSPAFSSSHQQQPNLESFHRSMTDEHTSNNDNNLAKASNTTSTPRRDNPNNGRLAPTMSPNILGPFRLAQKCFSFDSTLDEFPEAYHDDGDRVYLHLPPRKFPSSNTTSSRTLHHSKSWDVGPSQQSFFGTLRQTAGSSHHKHAKPRRLQSLGIDSPNKTSTPARNNQSIIELQTPQRIEIEREDALDILACLVERGVAAWNNNKNESDRTGVLAEDETTLDTSSTNESLIIAMAEDFRRLSKQQDYNVPEEDEKEHHSKRMAALNELLKSHTYALEMKRATVSASSWLKSIGRCPDSQTFMNTKVEGEVTIASNPGGQTSGEEDKSETAFSDSASKKMEMLSLKAMLHSAQMELKEKTEANRKLDEELSKCREEIGRLKSASRAEVSTHSFNPILDLRGVEYNPFLLQCLIPLTYFHSRFFVFLAATHCPESLNHRRPRTRRVGANARSGWNGYEPCGR